jgi:hypothetical protein
MSAMKFIGISGLLGGRRSETLLLSVGKFAIMDFIVEVRFVLGDFFFTAGFFFGDAFVFAFDVVFVFAFGACLVEPDVRTFFFSFAMIFSFVFL